MTKNKIELKIKKKKKVFQLHIVFFPSVNEEATFYKNCFTKTFETAVLPFGWVTLMGHIGAKTMIACPRSTNVFCVQQLC